MLPCSGTLSEYLFCLTNVWGFSFSQSCLVSRCEIVQPSFSWVLEAQESDLLPEDGQPVSDLGACSSKRPSSSSFYSSSEFRAGDELCCAALLSSWHTCAVLPLQGWFCFSRFCLLQHECWGWGVEVEVCFQRALGVPKPPAVLETFVRSLLLL